MDEEDFPFDIDAAIEEEQNMQFEDMYDGDQDYMEPDDVEKEMGVAAAGVGPSGMSWGGGGTALYSPPTTKYEPPIDVAIERDSGDNFESTRPIGTFSAGSLFTLAYPLATKAAPFAKITAAEYLHRLPQVGDAQLTTVLQDGSRFFLQSRKENKEAERNKLPASGSLLSVTMRQLGLDADKLQRNILTAKNKHSKLDAHAPLLSNESSLWVDKYSPRLFSQLLSSEKTNREVLKALKQWDPFVFGQKGQGKQKGDNRPFQKVLLLCGPPGTGKTTIAHVVAQHCGYRPMEMNASDDRSAEALRETIARAVTASTLDKDKRPNCIILDEIDGIDGRGPIEALIDIIKAPLKVEKKTGKSSSDSLKNSVVPLTRPLICICNDLFSPQLRELRKHAQIFVFSSPLEMRLVQRLRNVCLLEGIQVQSGALSMLAAATGFDIRSSINTLQFASLKSKAERGNGVSGAAGEVGAVLSAMLSSGLKDVDKDLFQVWREIFWLKEAVRAFSKKKRTDPLLKESPAPPSADHYNPESHLALSGGTLSRGGKLKVIDVASLRKARDSEFGPHSGTTAKPTEAGAMRCSAGYAIDIVDSVIGFGDNQLIVDGLFENYLGVRYQDPAMSRTSASADWLCDADLWQGKYGGDALSDGYQTAKYVPLAAGAIHLLCSAGTRPDLSWPKKESNMRFTRQQREAIVQSVVEGSPQHSPSLRQKLIVAMEVIPYMFDIISPRIRPAAMQTLSKAEQELLKHAASIMSSCGIRYEYQSSVLSSILSSNYEDSTREEGGEVEAYTEIQNENSNGNLDANNFAKNVKSEDESLFLLTPAINELLAYEPTGELSGRRRPIAPEVKNMFYLETQKFIISAKREAINKMEIINDLPQQDIIHDIMSDIIPMSVVPVAASKSQGMFFSKSNISKKRALENTGELTPAANLAAKKQLIRFRFSQGFSAAVKRPVKINEFL